MSIREALASKLGRHMFDIPESFHMNGSKCLEIGHDHFRSSSEADKMMNKQILPVSESELSCRVRSYRSLLIPSMTTLNAMRVNDI